MTKHSLTKHIKTAHFGHGTTKPAESDKVQSAQVVKVLSVTISTNHYHIVSTNRLPGKQMAVILIMATLSTLRPGPLCALIVSRYVNILLQWIMQLLLYTSSYSPLTGFQN